MANATFDEKVDDLISKHVAMPKLTIGGDKPYHSLLPGRDPNDPMDRVRLRQPAKSRFRGDAAGGISRQGKCS